MKTKTLLLDTLPSWYRLSWNASQNALQIHIAEAYIAALPPIPDNSPLRIFAEKKVSGDLFASYSLDLTAKQFGFNGSVRRLDATDPKTGFVSFSVALPRVHTSTGMACQECGGTGESDDHRCFHCNGFKLEMKYDWYGAYSITESLQLLFWLLDIRLEAEMHTEVPQLFTLHLCAERSMHGSSMGGHLGKDALKMLRCVIASGKERCVNVERRITEALTQSWQHMMAKCDYDNHNLRVEIREDANLFITCPGDAAGVYTVNENWRASYDKGCDISCHNMDNPTQALACLAGLAVFSEELEKEWLLWNE
ncbi:MAG: hypothetical protein A3C08_02645 [Candidatus Taylorbacteria bacterium RIFCSPHIGHO2_02_FULL_47_18]|uniref:Uncharacterized protein n=1 Tax=Candidatus Taylorbacteria bacterium RIFCSPLOWO2_01_FULL_48_100 TaxID=1802322 RepID=A0A1G2NFX9_9BACT|nr:MAG: hypothetical protein A2670_02355 [Candidatus Taylorbacteria bacterium RIFCSPHIGHO2_01_FULL_48_38]OHA27599.1 MAG: hypothetical protein A3C08_02645 [Candidatus Taylorbacteria bacterium RIFCSPHIGHO2_02_FULL_47_18]OHA34291.1 MAG: hypothetical protein A2938_02030 [Candidatus Taylorbacteria bacterium RIFCSPLOWO2_01_FULL_48_100]OHA40445.1 MAG: hypothetical protein A3J31_02665 [Candidatus Taylorbacteria bacterium RIFCSPLOWO2_02_FULL_48_16]OHA44915.1 MAG: hypothetical protein A3H13_03360 [Candid